MADGPRQAKLRKIGVYLLSAAFILWGIIALASGRFQGAGGVFLSTIGLGLIGGGLLSIVRAATGRLPVPEQAEERTPLDGNIVPIWRNEASGEQTTQLPED